MIAYFHRTEYFSFFIVIGSENLGQVYPRGTSFLYNSKWRLFQRFERWQVKIIYWICTNDITSQLRAIL